MDRGLHISSLQAMLSRPEGKVEIAVVGWGSGRVLDSGGRDVCRCRNGAHRHPLRWTDRVDLRAYIWPELGPFPVASLDVAMPLRAAYPPLVTCDPVVSLTDPPSPYSGHCSREQSYRPSDCSICHSSLVSKKGTGFWEGGKGTRDKSRMSRKDPRKYKRRGGTKVGGGGK
ncbi:hypothetical protein B0A48_15636 [Cryoendolithus antarcticus]|uniref:Uncharacterized protein n=1 Tax=Cryoendolithus antarcticus TaxID=1507870 RepID=A0A1V8SGT8_9PEZI|nr:hypothetical protein B0A48_15636 [Cryoendolithus antarcticus]